MALTLTGRLLCAASHAYSIEVAGVAPPSPSPPTPPRSDQIGYLNPPRCFVGGPDNIDAGLVGETSSEIIVAFRGTLPPDSPDHTQMILDWANDIDAPLVAEDGGAPGLVHQGFQDSLNNLWPAMGPAITAQIAAAPNKPLYFCGHSKGGAVANLAAVRCKQEHPAANPMVCTFAAARCGDQTFANAYNIQIPHSVRYEYADDIVPHLPPSDALAALLMKVPSFAPTAAGLTLGYVSVGDLLFINWDGAVVGDSPVLDIQRLSHLTLLMLELGFAQIAADHSIDLNSGYANAICPGV